MTYCDVDDYSKVSILRKVSYLKFSLIGAFLFLRDSHIFFSIEGGMLGALEQF